MKYYVFDSTLGKQAKYYSHIGEVIEHLEQSIRRFTGKSRQQFMQDLYEVGASHDEATGRNFTEQMSNYVETGIFRDGRHIRCNIHDAFSHIRHASETGD